MDEIPHDAAPVATRAPPASTRSLGRGPGRGPGRGLGPALVVGAALCAAAVGWRVAAGLERDRFEHASGLLLRTAGERVVETRGVLRSMVGMHYASDEFAGADIEAFAEQLRIHTPFVESLGIAAAVEPGLREDYERYAISVLGRERPVRGWVVDPDGGPSRAVAVAARATGGPHWVVDSVESPDAGDAPFVGTDLATVPALAARLEVAIGSGRGFAAPVPAAWPVPGDALLVQPVYLDERAPADPAARRESLVGAVWVTLGLADWLDAGRGEVGDGVGYALSLDDRPVAAGSRERHGVGVDGRGLDLGFGTARVEREWQLGDSRVRVVSEARLGASAANVASIAAVSALAALFTLALLGLSAQRRLRRTERAEATRILAAEREQAHRTLESISDAVLRLDADGTCRFANPTAVRWFGIETERAATRPSGHAPRFERADGHGRVDPLELLRAGTASPGDAPGEPGVGRSPSLDVRAPDTPRGDATFALTVSRVHDGEDGRGGALLVLQDVGSERRMTAELERRAHTDPLTGCHNRFYFERRLRELVDDAATGTRRHAFCSIDLDRFKIVNDTCGHPAGDRLLRELGEALRPLVRSDDVLARLGGDEFGILLTDVVPASVERVAGALREHFRTAAFEHEGHVFPVRASIGIVGIAGPRADADRVLEAADAACYAAKRGGRDAIVVRLEDDGASLDEAEDVPWVPVLERAMEADRIALATRRVGTPGTPGTPGALVDAAAGIEVSVLLSDEDGNALDRAAWGSSAERHGLLPRIERRALELALDVAGSGPVGISVSGPTLDDADFAPWLEARLEARLAARGTDGMRLRLLIAEDIVLARFAACAALATRLAAVGVRCTLDRFGAEHSALGALGELPFDSVRFDRRWTEGLGRDPRVRDALGALCALAHASSLKTVVDGIDEERALAALTGLAVDHFQGAMVDADARARAA